VATVDWNRLDFATRAGVVASVMALLGMIIPPLGIASALVAIAFSAVGWRRAHSRGNANPVARFCLLGCLALIVLVIGGNAIYAQG
jgi:hypothetical protein